MSSYVTLLLRRSPVISVTASVVLGLHLTLWALTPGATGAEQGAPLFFIVLMALVARGLHAPRPRNRGRTMNGAQSSPTLRADRSSALGKPELLIGT